MGFKLMETCLLRWSHGVMHSFESTSASHSYLVSTFEGMSRPNAIHLALYLLPLPLQSTGIASFFSSHPGPILIQPTSSLTFAYKPTPTPFPLVHCQGVES